MNNELNAEQLNNFVAAFTAANEPLNVTAKAVVSAANALSAKLQVFAANQTSGAELTEHQQMLAAVTPHIQQKGELKYLGARGYAGDIPPAALWGFYNKLMQTPEPIATPAAMISEAGSEEEKKTLAAAQIDIELARAQEKHGEQLVAEIAQAQDYILQAVSSESVRKANRIKNDTLFTMARAAGLVAEGEINLAHPTGWGFLSRHEISKRIFNYYHDQPLDDENTAI